VLSISFMLALLSVFFVRPDRGYLEYIDYRTLAILLSLMLVMEGLKELKVFREIGEALIVKVNSTRGLALVMILLNFFFSMLITNDVALITFVPFTIIVLSVAKKEDHLIPVIVLETIAANLGSMMTPIGNPQNLYLYSIAGMTISEFFGLMLPYASIALALLMVFCLVVIKKDQVEPVEREVFKRSKREMIELFSYLFLFFLALLVVSRFLPYYIGLLITLLVVLILDRKIIRRADYSLLLTFIFLFIFIGNMKRIHMVSAMLASVVIGNEFFASVVTSQFISNVPAAILLSGFTDNIRELIIGTNIGGLGTLIASMASLISYKQYGVMENARRGAYFKTFTIYNLLFLLAMIAFYVLI